MEARALGQALNKMLQRFPVSLCVLLAACGGQALDVGASAGSGGAAGSSGMVTPGGASPGGASPNGSAGTGTGSPSAGSGVGGSGPQVDPDVAPVVPWPDAECVDAEPAASVSGTWKGYLEGQGHEFDYTLQLAGDEEHPCGTVTFGEPTPLEPATDASAGYLAGADTSFKTADMVPGFAYTALSAELSGARLQFRLSYAEPYGSWCALQESHYISDANEYRCLPNVSSVPKSDGCHASDGNVYSCEQLGMCEALDPPCACDADGCIASVEASGATFDLHVDGAEASGNLRDVHVSGTTYLARD